MIGIDIMNNKTQDIVCITENDDPDSKKDNLISNALLSKEAHKIQEEKDVMLSLSLANKEEISSMRRKDMYQRLDIMTRKHRTHCSTRGGESATGALGRVIFYSANISLSPTQIISTIHRLVVQASQVPHHFGFEVIVDNGGSTGVLVLSKG